MKCSDLGSWLRLPFRHGKLMETIFEVAGKALSR